MKNSSIKQSLFKISEGILIALFWLCIWWTLTFFVKGFYLPGPKATLGRVYDLLQEKDTYSIIFGSLYRVVVSIIVALILGVALGALAGLIKKLDKLLNPAMVCIKSTPVLSFIIIVTIYIKSSQVPIFCSALLCTPIVYSNVLTGIRVVDKDLLEMSKVYRVKSSLIFKKVYLPSIIPYVNAAAIVCLGMAWKITVAAEVLSVLNQSIGFMIYNAKVILEFEDVFAWTILIIICSFIIEILVKNLLKKNKYYKGMKINNV